ncbi:hypothetical protein VOLCADRAFT_116135 [Volvox carteri f. nagariensis]|uniref:Uracil-DNA glycosylase-like domain-containing protein n=1 Tax=Volvox carteri f. nagariensis TaxID=3068 RepID=D8TKR3_VOLCA|nr:uncharacterized protein VOLCADRAFT_116135 [Volvox carteri f. nagariensis]EFJ51932.1 hypothetical protein VOLCADRAFT_116135 [Volvox carteri f. nagariensis]|eukprot:XP_002946706.1 hypothetical protein VOLCADRAFT_116135 [Volvox carteri f. nagariensis]
MSDSPVSSAFEALPPPSSPDASLALFTRTSNPSPPAAAAAAAAAPGNPGGGPATAAAAASKPPPPSPLTPRGVPEKLGDQPLRLIIVGHNPSAHAWQSGHYYSNPSNHMWRLLVATGIAPSWVRGAQDDDRLPGAVGVGFLDVGCGHPGTDSSSFKSEVFLSWSRAFYTRLRDHMARAAASIGCTCGCCGAPCFVAFSGKRQFLELLNVDRAPRDRVKTVEHGPQVLLPREWPFPRTRTAVWVCSSTSGAAALTRQQREEPYRQLAEKLKGVPWPRKGARRCCGGVQGEGEEEAEEGGAAMMPKGAVVFVNI